MSKESRPSRTVKGGKEMGKKCRRKLEVGESIQQYQQQQKLNEKHK
jgi:hypothetical protein